MSDILEFLKNEGINEELINGIKEFRAKHQVEEGFQDRIPDAKYLYYGKDVWEKAIAALLVGENVLLSGPKATGKNVLSENLALVFNRPIWDVSFHINVDASYLIGTDTYDGNKVVFREGPIYLCAKYGGFGILDEINMARNEALAVLHSVLDFRRVLDVAGYERINLNDSTRFIGTMNYGYAGTRELNAALASRFAIIDMPIISNESMVKLINHSFPNMKEEIRDQFIELFYELHKKAEHADISDRAVDLRGLLDAIRLIERGLKSQDALSMCIVNKSFDAYERELIQDVIDARIPHDLLASHVFE